MALNPMNAKRRIKLFNLVELFTPSASSKKPTFLFMALLFKDVT
jgi:hypothetical protein